MNVIEFFGWAGAILVLIAYFLVSTKKADPESIRFQLINIFGGSFLIIYTYHCNATASMTVNIIWVVIGLHSISRPLTNPLMRLKTRFFMKNKFKLIPLMLGIVFLFSSSLIHAQDSEYVDTESDIIDTVQDSDYESAEGDESSGEEMSEDESSEDSE